MIEERSAFGGMFAVRLQDERVLIVGGQDMYDLLGTAELYWP